MFLFDKLDPEEVIAVPLNLRACLYGHNEVRFLVRYEVDKGEEDDGNDATKYRFARSVLNLDVRYAFSISPTVNLSAKRANEHIVNIQVIDKMAPGFDYQTPEILSI